MMPAYRLAAFRRRVHDARLIEGLACAAVPEESLSQDYVQGLRVLDDPDPPGAARPRLILEGS